MTLASCLASLTCSWEDHHASLSRPLAREGAWLTSEACCSSRWFASLFRPKAILVEQVKGLLGAPDDAGCRGGVFKLFLEQLRGVGYEPVWKLLNTADYGVPQARERVFIVSTPPPNRFEF